jgi:hypothetical protein
MTVQETAKQLLDLLSRRQLSTRNDMKVQEIAKKVIEYFNRPNVVWVDHCPTVHSAERDEQCLVTCTYFVIDGLGGETNPGPFFNTVRKLIGKDSIPCWNDSHTREDVMNLLEDIVKE